MLKIAFAPIYKYELPKGHRFPMEKYELIPQQLLHEGIVSENQFFHPSRLLIEDILLTHTEEYWNKLRDNDLSAKEIRKIGFPVRPELIERGRYISQGTIECVNYALENGISMNIAGGTHHAFADRGEGFCIFNDFAIAANYYLNLKVLKKILIIDLDVHQGNGTAKIFENDRRVFTFSMHGEKNYPLRKEFSNLDIGLKDKITDNEYLEILKFTLPKIIIDFKPDFVMYLAGVDVLATDKLGRLNLTKIGCKERDRIVFETCKNNQIPVSVSMGGGYSERIADIIDAHVNTFRVAQEVWY